MFTPLSELNIKHVYSVLSASIIYVYDQQSDLNSRRYEEKSEVKQHGGSSLHTRIPLLYNNNLSSICYQPYHKVTCYSLIERCP